MSFTRHCAIVISGLRADALVFVLASRQMKSTDLDKSIPKSGEECTADQMDLAVNRIIRTLRGGKPARLPGLGTITPGKKWAFEPERNDR
jgi:hypothetical protein